MYIDIFKKLNISIEKEEYYIPKIDFNKIDTTTLIKNYFINNKYDKFILLCNNKVNSGQSQNFNFDPIIDNISNKYKKFLFIITNETNIKKSNVVHVNDIINKKYDNLVDIGYLSTKCDIIIGRASGPFCFSHITDNINNENNMNRKKMLVFSFEKK